MRREQEPSPEIQNPFRRQELISGLEKMAGAGALFGASLIEYLPVNIPVALGGVALIVHSFIGDRRRSRQ